MNTTDKRQVIGTKRSWVQAPMEAAVTKIGETVEIAREEGVHIILSGKKAEEFKKSLANLQEYMPELRKYAEYQERKAMAQAEGRIASTESHPDGREMQKIAKEIHAIGNTLLAAGQIVEELKKNAAS